MVDISKISGLGLGYSISVFRWRLHEPTNIIGGR